MNITETHNCYGCGVCALSCPKKIIDIHLNGDGFYEPYITKENADLCIDCGLCLDVCAFNKETLAKENNDFIKTYGGWSLSSEVRYHCSSGGVCFEVAKFLLEKGYKIIAVRYNVDKHRAEHYIASSLEELLESRGSKYIQSYTFDALKEINRKEKYLFIGSPCQVDSLKHYIKKFHLEKNFFLIDFFCHGVPSYLLWKKYVTSAEKKVGKITHVSWRNKTTGWYDSWAMKIVGFKNKTINENNVESENIIQSRATQGDLFYRFFLGDMCLGSACYDNCKYKGINSSADIRIGDMWGHVYKNNKDGVNGIITFSNQGDAILRESNVKLIEHTFDEVSEGQMKASPSRPAIYDKVKLLLQDNKIALEKIAPIVVSYLNRKRLIRILKNPLCIIKRIF